MDLNLRPHTLAPKCSLTHGHACFCYVLFQAIWVIMLVLGVLLSTRTTVEGRKARIMESFEYPAISCRGHSASITDYGGVGDGKASNTKAFKDAVNHLSQYGSDGGAQLIVPAGKWLTGSFNLTSHFTLYLHKDAVLLASQVPFLSPSTSHELSYDSV